MKYNFRIFFKNINDKPSANSCKNIELVASNFKSACKIADNLAKKDKLRVVMVAELPE